MQQLLQRLAWRNLPIGTKIVLLFAIILLAILVISFITRGAYANLAREFSEGGEATIEMRTRAQNLQINVEAIQRLLIRVVEQQYGWNSFELSRARLTRDHTSLIGQVNIDAARVQDLAATMMAETELTTVSIEVRGVQTNLTSLEENFSQLMDLIGQLAATDTGLLDNFASYGDQLENLTLALGDAEMSSQVRLMRNLEQTLIASGSPDDLAALQEAIERYLVIYQTNIPLTQRQDEIPAAAELYLDSAGQIAQVYTQIQTVYQASQLSIDISRTASSRLVSITENLNQAQLARINELQRSASTGSLIGIAIMMALATLLGILFSRNITSQTRSLLIAARQLEVGNLSTRAPVPGEDELSQLAESFNAMADQIQDLIGGLERRVAERTRDLTITADIGRAVTALPDPRDLMFEIVELIRQRFGYYHAQVFMVDDAGENAVLVSSTGAAGRELLARRHSLSVGSDSVIGQVTARNIPIVAYDTGASDVVHRPNPLLPDTRSEMALPMRIGDRVIGALDVQSVAPNAFDEDIVAVFQVMADQLAIALDNARLQTELARTREQIAAIERRIVAEAWSDYESARRGERPLVYEFREDSILPETQFSPAPLNEAIARGQITMLDDGHGELNLAVPIKVRGEVIGAFGFGGESLAGLSEEDLQLVEAIVDRVGIALENLRLVEETARRVEHEQILNEITAKIVGATDVNQILQTTVRELGRVLRAPQTSVQLRQESAGS